MAHVAVHTVFMEEEHLIGCLIVNADEIRIGDRLKCESLKRTITSHLTMAHAWHVVGSSLRPRPDDGGLQRGGSVDRQLILRPVGVVCVAARSEPRL